MPFIIFERSANYSKLFQFQRKMIDSDGCHHYRRPLLVLTEHDLFAFGANVLGISFSLACARTSEASEYVRTYAKCVCVCVCSFGMRSRQKMQLVRKVGNVKRA